MQSKSPSATIFLKIPLLAEYSSRRLGWLGRVRYSTSSTLSCFSRIEGGGFWRINGGMRDSGGRLQICWEGGVRNVRHSP